MTAPNTQNEPSIITADSGKLDVVRSLAVLLVVISHLPITKHGSDLLFGVDKINVQPIGLVGVGIFFVHTCLVLMASLERQTLEDGNKMRFRIFLVKRVFRINPLSIVAVLILTLTTYAFSNSTIDLSQVLSNLLLIQNLTGDNSVPGALWSLPYEVQMYLFLPVLYLLITKFKKIAPELILSLWGASVLLVFALFAAHQNYHLVKYLPAFLPGVLAFTLISRAKSRSTLAAYSPAIYIIAISLLFPFLVSAGIKENILIWPTCLTLGIILPYSSEISSPIIKSIASSIAKYSYGIYLIHGPMIYFSFDYVNINNSLSQWLLFILGTLGISYAAFHLVENPGIRLGKRFARIVQPHKLSSPRNRMAKNIQ